MALGSTPVIKCGLCYFLGAKVTQKHFCLPAAIKRCYCALRGGFGGRCPPPSADGSPCMSSSQNPFISVSACSENYVHSLAPPALGSGDFPCKRAKDIFVRCLRAALNAGGGVFLYPAITFLFVLGALLDTLVLCKRRSRVLYIAPWPNTSYL